MRLKTGNGSRIMRKQKESIREKNTNKWFKVGPHELVNVYKGRNPYVGSWEKAEISWMAINPTNISTTTKFRDALDRAIKYAKKLDEKYPPNSDSLPDVNPLPVGKKKR